MLTSTSHTSYLRIQTFTYLPIQPSVLLTPHLTAHPRVRTLNCSTLVERANQKKHPRKESLAHKYPCISVLVLKKEAYTNELPTQKRVTPATQLTTTSNTANPTLTADSPTNRANPNPYSRKTYKANYLSDLIKITSNLAERKEAKTSLAILRTGNLTGELQNRDISQMHEKGLESIQLNYQG